jgi:hypothetical protein
VRGRERISGVEIVADGAREDEGFLWNGDDVLADRGAWDGAEVDVID